jgi:hypothetical protein
MAIQKTFHIKYNSHIGPLLVEAKFFPLIFFVPFDILQFMQYFAKGLLPTSFSETWFINAIRRPEQSQTNLAAVET